MNYVAYTAIGLTIIFVFLSLFLWISYSKLKSELSDTMKRNLYLTDMLTQRRETIIEKDIEIERLEKLTRDLFVEADVHMADVDTFILDEIYGVIDIPTYSRHDASDPGQIKLELIYVMAKDLIDHMNIVESFDPKSLTTTYKGLIRVVRR